MPLDMYKRGYSDGLIAAIIELELIRSQAPNAAVKEALWAAKEQIASLQKSRSLNTEQ